MTQTIDPKGKTIVVTGAASGIGREIARQMADLGAQVVVADINRAGLDAVASELEGNGTQVLSRPVDMADLAAVDAFAAEAMDWAQGTLVLVYANAGIHGITSGIDPDMDLFERVIAVNLMGPIYMSKAFLPRLVAQRIPAQFVITGSQASFLAAPGISPYVAAKHGLWGFADTLRMELAMDHSPVGVSLVAPGRADTGITRQRLGEYREQGGEKAVEDYLASMVGPEKIAEVVVRESQKRAFWIIPSHEPCLEMFKARADAIIEAMPAGEIEV